MKLKTKRNGMIILIGSVIPGFLFPSYAKWILLALVIMGLVSWMSKKEN